MVGGVNIPGSVFSVTVLSPPETRGQPLHTLQRLKFPFDIAVSSRGQVVVSELYACCISIFTCEFQLITWVGSFGACGCHFNAPGGVAIPEDDLIFVANIDSHCLQVLTM